MKTSHGGEAVVTESAVHSAGVHHYAVVFTQGELSPADGVGFMFGGELPCRQDPQVASVFVSKRGNVFLRSSAGVRYEPVSQVAPLSVGAHVEMHVDLERQEASVFVGELRRERQNATFSIAHVTPDLTAGRGGYFMCIVKNAGVAVSFVAPVFA